MLRSANLESRQSKVGTLEEASGDAPLREFGIKAKQRNRCGVRSRDAPLREFGIKAKRNEFHERERF